VYRESRIACDATRRDANGDASAILPARKDRGTCTGYIALVDTRYW